MKTHSVQNKSIDKGVAPTDLRTSRPEHVSRTISSVSELVLKLLWNALGKRCCEVTEDLRVDAQSPGDETCQARLSESCDPNTGEVTIFSSVDTSVETEV